MSIKGIITDIASTICDKGTVVPLLAMKKAWGDFGLDVSYNMLNAGMGSSKADHIRITQNLLKTDKAYKIDMDKLIHRVEYHTIKILKEDKSHSVLFDDLPMRFKYLQSKGYKIGHTSGYTYNMIEPILNHWKTLHDYVPNAIVGSNEVPKGRPYPDSIIKCSIAMLLPIKECINIDDSEVGIKAGNNANIRSIGVYKYGNWRGPIELEYKNRLISSNKYEEAVNTGMLSEIEKMKKITKHVFPTTSYILQNIDQFNRFLYGDI